MGRLKMPFPKRFAENKKLGGEKKKMNTKDGKKYTGIILAAIIVSAVFAMAMPAIVRALPQGATDDAGPTSTKSLTSAGSNISKGGYVTEINFSTEQRTAKWQGYYGNVTGSIVLEDGDDHEMFNWTWYASKGGEVIATTNDSIPPWESLAATAIDGSDMDTIGSLWGWESTQSDDARHTFEDHDTSVVIAGISIGTTNGTDSLGAGNAGDFKEVVLTDGATAIKKDFLFVAIINDDAIAFDGTAKDFEMLVPVGDTPASTEQYYFYVELT
jgi:hypothetical protein